jgi:hypothetical protein
MKKPSTIKNEEMKRGQGQGQDLLGRYEWARGFERIIKYYPQQGRYACVYAQQRHGLIAATCIYCAEKLGKAAGK